MEEGRVVKTAFAVSKVVTTCLDVLTLPVYTLMYRPWNHWRKRGIMYSKESFDDRPMSAGFKRIVRDGRSCIEDLSTMKDLIQRNVDLYGERDCFGTREVFKVEEEKQPDGKIFKKFTLGGYSWMTYNEVDERINIVGRGLIEAGIRPRQNMVIFAETRIEWMLTALATLRFDIALVTLYTTLGAEELIHGVNETEVTHMVTSQDLLPKVIKLLPRITALTHIIYMENPGSKETPPSIPGIHLIPYSRLLELGKTSGRDVDGVSPTPSSTAIIMYTSGSTGVPKGVVISHFNLLSSIKGATTIYPEPMPEDCLVSYLPLAHVMELACEFMVMSMGSKIGYSSPQTLTDKSTGIKTGQHGDVILLRPTMMLAIPLILDRVKKGILEAAQTRNPIGKLLLQGAVHYKSFWTKAGYGTPLLDRVMFKKIKDVLGGRVRYMAIGSAPLSVETFEFIKNVFDIMPMLGYGLTETTSTATVNGYLDLLDGTNLGCPLEGVHIRFIDWPEGGYTVKDYPNPRGEIIVGGNTVAEGYYKNELLTNETFFEEDGIRWCYTGDIGELLPDGNLRIIDRKKDLVKLQFGEYVSLGKVEAELKTSPLVDNICVHGDSRYAYLVALITPNEKSLLALAESLGYGEIPFSDACDEKKIVEALTAHLISHGNSCNLNKMEIPTRVKLCAEEWLPESGLVTAALKIRRKRIRDFYGRDLHKLYDGLRIV